MNNLKNNNGIPSSIILTPENIVNWPKWNNLLVERKIKFDVENQLRYLHGAPVGELVLIRVNKDGVPIYKELAEGWFDPDSPRAKEFKWPK